MGNCIKKESSMKSEDEDWVSLGSDRNTSVIENVDYYYNSSTEERKSLIEENHKSGFLVSSSSSSSDSSNHHHEVRIKVSKKELEHLLKKADVEGLPLQQILVQLMMNGGDDLFEKNQRSWRPALQSIPE